MKTNDDGAGRFPPAPSLVINPIRRAFRLQPDQRSWPAALSASAATALPVLIGWLAGDVTAGLLATTGSFTALYGIGRPYLNRGVHLAVIGVCFAVAVALGDWAAENEWLGVLTVALIAMGAVLLCNAFAAGPGAYLFVLGCAAATSAAPDHLSPWYLGLLVLGGSALGWLAQMAGALVAPRGPERAAVARSADAVVDYIHAVGSADEATTRHRAAQSLYAAWNVLVTLQPAGAADAVRRLRRVNYELHSVFAEAMATASRPDPPGFDAAKLAARLPAVRGSRAETDSDGVEDTVVGNPGPIDTLRQAITPGSVPLWSAARVGIAVLVAGLIGVAADLDRSYWAMAAAALMLHQGLDWIRTLQKGIERLLGTQAGLVLAAAVLAFHPRGLALVLLLGLLQFAIVTFTVRSYAISVVFTTGMALVIDSGIGVVDVGALLLARGSETLLGCLVALVVYLVTARLDRSSRLPVAIALTVDAVAATLPYLATESVTTTDARIARRDLHMRATNLLPVYEATVLGVGRQRDVAESMWPAVAAAEQLAYRTSAECWSIERAAAVREPGNAAGWTTAELNHVTTVLGRLSAAFRTGRSPGDAASAVPFMDAEIAVMADVVLLPRARQGSTTKKVPMHEIIHEIKIAATPERVFAALTTLEGIQSWQTPLAEGTGAVGSEWVFTFTGRAEFAWEIVASDAPRNVEWRCTEGPGDSVGTSATFEIYALDEGRSLLRFTHAGWPGTHGNFHKCNTTWGVLLHHIQQFVETGTPATAFQ